MKQKKILSILGQVDEKYIEEAAPAKFTMENSAVIRPFKVRGKIKTALIAAAFITLACTTVATAAYLYQVYIANRDTALPSYEITAELNIQTVSSDAMKELSQMPYQTYKTSYAEAENFLDVDLLISDQLDSAVLGEGVDIQGSYAKGERPITSLTLFSRHDTGITMSGYIDMTVYMSIGTKKPYEQITQILNPELLEKDAILSEYVSEVNGVTAKFAVYETVGYANAYFVDNGILYNISIGGFVEEENIDLAEYLKGLIDTFK
ncbi:MAG TPA: hypothetical protein DCZ91_25760 [Lachnospiraceae bacterium]|nr:hypothetical protein [Lachnospiraceae bacterium]